MEATIELLEKEIEWLQRHEPVTGYRETWQATMDSHKRALILVKGVNNAMKEGKA